MKHHGRVKKGKVLTEQRPEHTISPMHPESTPVRGWSTRLVVVLLAGGAAVLLTAAVALVILVRGGGSPHDAAAAGGPGVSTVAPAQPVPTGAAPTSAAPTGGASPSGPAPTAGPVPPEAAPVPVEADAGAAAIEAQLAGSSARTIRFTFDAAPGDAVRDAAGRYALRELVAGGGDVTFARRDRGYTARFPARCSLAPDQCPRAILESTRADVFNPGGRPVRFGADVLMTSADTARGANVLQKGFSVGGGSQFKVQVDGSAGRPSCGLASGGTIYRLIGRAGVADGRWHRIICTRAGGLLSLNVDGRAISRRVPAELSIHNPEPLRIGGKNVGPNNDQFAGRIDNAFVVLY